MAPNMALKLYLMSCYLYYVEDVHVITDTEFDRLGKYLLSVWDDVDHPHKSMITPDDLRATTGYAINSYPYVLAVAARGWYKAHTTGVDADMWKFPPIPEPKENSYGDRTRTAVHAGADTGADSETACSEPRPVNADSQANEGVVPYGGVMNAQPMVLDVECFPNYFLVLIQNKQGQTKAFEQYDGHPFDGAGLLKFLEHPKLEFITFNGNSYDIPVLSLAIAGATCAELWEATERIIVKGMKHWEFYKLYRIDPPNINHIDLIEVCIGQVSLKIYGGRLHTKRMQDMPYPPGTVLTRDQMIEVRDYCANDLANTWDVANDREPQINQRRQLSEQYGVDLRSKSDAQIAEAVLKAETFRLTGHMPKKVPIRYNSFHYVAPEYIKFRTPELQNVLSVVTGERMMIKDTGHVIMPKAIEALTITIGTTRYNIGLGGLHSQESEAAHYADDETILVDRDVTSYYPSLMINMGVNPEAFGGHFTKIYQGILEARVAAKHAGNSVVADLLKITLNGTFGKTSSKYSILYDPEKMVKTTLTGQLSLLMLIEWLELYGIPVVSANTDGVVIKCPKAKEAAMEAIVKKWEVVCHLDTEATYYKAIYSRDVNNYLAITTKGKVKQKGIFTKSGIGKNPQNDICTEAVIAYLKDGVPLEDTIRGCTDIRKFLTLRTVAGGALHQGNLIGKAIRWYYATGVDGYITYATNGNRVPRSKGAKPLMVLPDEFPADVDYNWYVREAKELLRAVGAVPRQVLPKLPRKNTKAWKAAVAAGQIVEYDEDVWVWSHDERVAE